MFLFSMLIQPFRNVIEEFKHCRFCRTKVKRPITGLFTLVHIAMD